MKHPRIMAASLTLSAAAFVGLIAHEGFTDKAIIPTKNDRPTVGFGSTFNEDGSPVKMGDTITAPQAVARSYSHIGKDEAGLKKCVLRPLNQVEYDLLVDHAYQYGVKTTCNSSMVRHINAGRYIEACHAYTLYKFSGGYDCSIPGNKVCSGVWKRSLNRRDKCLESQ